MEAGSGGEDENLRRRNGDFLPRLRVTVCQADTCDRVSVEAFWLRLAGRWTVRWPYPRFWKRRRVSGGAIWAWGCGRRHGQQRVPRLYRRPEPKRKVACPGRGSKHGRDLLGRLGEESKDVRRAHGPCGGVKSRELVSQKNCREGGGSDIHRKARQVLASTSGAESETQGCQRRQFQAVGESTASARGFAAELAVSLGVLCRRRRAECELACLYG